jgi:hypothetical protein
MLGKIEDRHFKTVFKAPHVGNHNLKRIQSELSEILGR